MLDTLLQQFIGSQQGHEAVQTLQQQHGMSDTEAQNTLGAAATGAAQALGGGQGTSGEGGGLGQMIGGLTQGGGAGIMGALGGLAQGGGLASALQGGLGGAASEKIAEVISARTGIAKGTALSVANTVIPFIVKFLQSHTGGQGGQTGEAPKADAGQSAQDVVGGLFKKLF